MAVDYCKLPPHRIGFVPTEYTDGGGNIDVLTKDVKDSE